MKGSTIKRGSTWTCYWSTTDPATGKRRQHSRGGFRLQRDAQRHLAGVMEAVNAGTWRPERALTVSELLVDHYLPARTAEGLRPATIAQYGTVARSWLIPHLGGTEVRALSPARLSVLTETLRSDGSTLGRGGLSPRSVQLAATVLKASTAWASASGLIARDPLLGARRPRAAASTVGTAWTLDEARSFLASVADDRLVAMWTLLLTRGPRRGELAGLRWDAVDLDGGAMQIATTRIVVNGRAVESVPKTAAGCRKVLLDAALVAVLRSHKARQGAERLAAGQAWEASGYVFCDELGRAYHPDYFSSRFEALAGLAELRRIRLHDTRHTAASIMLDAGEEITHVSKILGHSSTRVTEEIYRHIMATRLEATGAVISNLLLGAGGGA